ncbi:aspartate kinase [Anaerosphaera aminiphila DSM 21120]|uniref:Aspartokinase n=1 Tax=Anaerosphaera aminiphila DSM 21120 TaxID=1120995 RepID=A0A1M5PP77_9FIRM|nr:aspartate kinase [Anaerosphaera aminiphila]SHH03587.1 aspartate kinase [Anaerosphaera aminiphila DSM 21120]
MSKKGVVIKYGGSSVATAEKLNQVADRIIRKKEEFKNIVTVVSAMGKKTNELLNLSEEISLNPNKREMDMLLSTGEQITIALLSMALNEKGHKAISLAGWQAGFRTFGHHMKSKVQSVDNELIEKYLEEGYIVIIAGFQGVNAARDITTLGRGGSDTSAVAIAASLEYPCEIYTDVEGIYTVDPRVYKDAKKLDYLSYEETLEMASLGAKVIEPRSVELAWKYNVPIYIALNTNDVEGTHIVKEGKIMEKKNITNLSIMDNILLVNIELNTNNPEIINDVFVKLGNENVNIDIISQNKFSDNKYLVSFTTTLDNREVVSKILREKKLNFDYIENVTKISIIGNAMRTQAGVASRAFEILSQNNVELHQVSTSEISISYVIDNYNVEKVVAVFVEEFNL